MVCLKQFKQMTSFNIYRVPCSTFIITHVCICSENYVIVPYNKDGNIAVWKSDCPSETPTVLHGHHKLVSALALSHYPSAYYLCSCSSDNIILWNLLEDGGNPKKGRVLHSHMEQPLHCCFDYNNQKIAISFTNGMWIFGLKENVWVASIENIHFTIFKFNFEGLIGVEENCLKVWNIDTNEIATKISIPSGFPTALCVCNQNNILIAGTTCGHVNVYEKSNRLIRNIPVWKVVSQNQKCIDKDEGTYQDIRSDSFPIHAILAFNVENENKPINDLPEAIYLLVVTSTCLFIVNINNEVVLFYLDFNNDVIDMSSKIGLVRSAAVAQDSSNRFVYITLIPVIGDSIVLLKLHKEKIIIEKENKNEFYSKMGADFNKDSLTFLSKNSCDSGKSLLTHSMHNNRKISALKKYPSTLNLPITFHSNIKSSGYGVLHKSVTLFQPQIPKTRRSQSLSLLNSRKFKTMSEPNKSSYDLDKEVNYIGLKLLDKVESFETPAISYLHTTADGTHACCPVSEGHVDVFKITKKTIRIYHTFSCHSGEVNSAKWSHTGRLIITCGKDKTTKLWDFEKSKQNPVLMIGHEKNSQSSKHKFLFEDSVTQAQFYYLDRFIIATSENKLYLFDYVINIEKSGIKSSINKSTLKLLKKIPLESKQITTMSAVNQYFSNLVLCAGTSKSIVAVDMTVGKVAWHSANSGYKAPHVIAVNEGSAYLTQAANMYDLFLTSSLIEGIKVWDLRTKKPILCYKEHKCRSFPCSAAFSPCGKYIVSGSEDKSAYIYDLRQLSYKEKMSNQTVDVFTSATFSPKSQLILSSLNGSIFLYGKDQH